MLSPWLGLLSKLLGTLAGEYGGGCLIRRVKNHQPHAIHRQHCSAVYLVWRMQDTTARLGLQLSFPVSYRSKTRGVPRLYLIGNYGNCSLRPVLHTEYANI